MDSDKASLTVLIHIHKYTLYIRVNNVQSDLYTTKRDKVLFFFPSQGDITYYYFHAEQLLTFVRTHRRRVMIIGSTVRRSVDGVKM